MQLKTGTDPGPPPQEESASWLRGLFTGRAFRECRKNRVEAGVLNGIPACGHYALLLSSRQSRSCKR
jgi:hypothetical protein